MPYTGRQIELIRARFEAFHDGQTRLGLGKLTWGGICNDIYGKTGVDMDTEVLRSSSSVWNAEECPAFPATRTSKQWSYI
jgi:hypothetical protein